MDFGKFVTSAGAEVIEAKDNWNYSRSLLFVNAIPYLHRRAHFIPSVENRHHRFPTGQRLEQCIQEQRRPTGVFTNAYTKPKATWDLNYIVGPETPTPPADSAT